VKVTGKGPGTDVTAAQHGGRGHLIVNADDWGRDVETTERSRECLGVGGVSAVSAMVFMADSERAAAISGDRGLDTGLHLNLTTPFSASSCSSRLRERQGQVARYLLRNRLAPVVFQPRLAGAFEYVVATQFDEFARLYKAEADRIDGHHHMHLCANVLLGGLLPRGTLVRRNFSFRAREKSLVNRLYRGAVDRLLARRHRVVDFFFSLAPVEPWSRLQRILGLTFQFVVELETHPIQPDEYGLLREGLIRR
jgi:hypothetical protein